MSPRLPNITADTMIRALTSAGWRVISHKGSHAHLKHVNLSGRLVIPDHSGDLKRPLMKAILRHAGLSEEEFRKLL